MINWDKPIRTKCGKPARVLCKDWKSWSSGVVVLVAVDIGEYETNHLFNLDGTRLGTYEIENIPEELYAVMYTKNNILSGGAWPTIAEARRIASDDPHKIYKLTEID